MEHSRIILTLYGYYFIVPVLCVLVAGSKEICEYNNLFCLLQQSCALQTMWFFLQQYWPLVFHSTHLTVPSMSLKFLANHRICPPPLASPGYKVEVEKCMRYLIENVAQAMILEYNLLKWLRDIIVYHVGKDKSTSWAVSILLSPRIIMIPFRGHYQWIFTLNVACGSTIYW